MAKLTIPKIETKILYNFDKINELLSPKQYKLLLLLLDGHHLDVAADNLNIRYATACQYLNTILSKIELKCTDGVIEHIYNNVKFKRRPKRYTQTEIKKRLKKLNRGNTVWVSQTDLEDILNGK